MAYKHSPEQIKSDAENAAKGVCPECSAVVDPKGARLHALRHWPRMADFKPDTDAARRSRLVLTIGGIRE